MKREALFYVLVGLTTVIAASCSQQGGQEGVRNARGHSL